MLISTLDKYTILLPVQGFVPGHCHPPVTLRSMHCTETYIEYSGISPKRGLRRNTQPLIGPVFTVWQTLTCGIPYAAGVRTAERRQKSSGDSSNDFGVSANVSGSNLSIIGNPKEFDAPVSVTSLSGACYRMDNRDDERTASGSSPLYAKWENEWDVYLGCKGAKNSTSASWERRPCG